MLELWLAKRILEEQRRKENQDFIRHAIPIIAQAARDVIREAYLAPGQTVSAHQWENSLAFGHGAHRPEDAYLWGGYYGGEYKIFLRKGSSLNFDPGALTSEECKTILTTIDEAMEFIAERLSTFEEHLRNPR